MSWQFYLEPLLELVGFLLYAVEEVHTDLAMKYSLEHPEDQRGYEKRATWGIGWDKSSKFWCDAQDWAKAQFIEHNHTNTKILDWYKYTYFFKRMISTRWSARKGS